MLFIQSSWKHTKATGEAGITFSSGFEGAGEVPPDGYVSEKALLLKPQHARIFQI